MLTMIRETLTVRLTRSRQLLAKLRSDRRANTAIIFGLAALPLISAVGCVVDYSTASMIKTRLQAAADAATLAAVSYNSPVVATAKSMSGTGTVSGGATYLQNFFGSDTTAFSGVSTSNVAVTKSGTTVTATLNFSDAVPTFFMKVIGYSSITVAGSSTASFTLASYIDFYLMLDVSGSMSFPSTPAEQVRLMSVNPDNLHPTNSPPNNGYPQGCQFACHWATQNTTCQNTSNPQNGSGPWQGAWPPSPQQYTGAKFVITSESSQWTNGDYPGGYCMGFIISRLGTTPVAPAGCVPASGTPPALNTNDSTSPAAAGSYAAPHKIPGTNTAYPSGCGQYVNWTNSQVSSCSSPGTTSCIQLQADAVGFAVNALLTQANTTETDNGVTNEYQVGLFPFIQNLCTSAAGSSNTCSVGLTSSLTGSTITTFAAQLASLLDNGGVGTANSTLGSGGTHFENALSSMNTFIATVGTGASVNSPLPYVFIVTDGSQDYQTQSSGNWGSQNWSSSAHVPNQNSATVMPPFSPNDQGGTINTTDHCAAMKSRGITIAILYIPYQPIQNPNSAFASNEDGYANSNIPNIPTALQSCASPGFFYTASSPTAITTDLVAMFNQATKTAHIAQ
jgi:Flp pilus assembly protein TadG